MRMRFNGVTATNMGVGILLNISVSPKYKDAVETLVNGFNSANEYEIKPYKEKRSLSANAYCWKLADLLAEKLHSTKEEIYRIAISYVGVFEEIKVSDVDAAKRFKRIWHSNGVGWLTKTINDTTIQAYYGSSIYNTQEMSRLIDFLQDECKRQKIEVKSKEEVESMLKAWGVDNAKESKK